MIIKNKAGKLCAVVYVDKGKADLLFPNKFQMRDVPLLNVAMEHTFVKDCGSPTKAIEEILK